MNVTKMEDDIGIWSWGQWAQPRLDRMMGVKGSGLAELIKQGSGWGDAAPSYSPPPRLPEEYCENLDRMIAAMGPEVVRVMVALYCYRMSLRGVARAARLSHHQVGQVRDSALNQLYGALFLQRLAKSA